MTSSNLIIPQQLQPTPFFVKLAEQAGDRLTYSRHYLHLLYSQKSSLTPTIEAWINQYQPSNLNLVLGDVETLLTRYPASIQQELREQIQNLLDQLNPLYPFPEGETLETAYVTVITQALGEFLPGTVVYVRQTNLATIQFLLRHVVVNLKTGKPSLIGLGHLPAPHSHHLSPLDFQGPPLGSSFFDAALSIGGSLVWALPHPWGAFSSAGIEVLRLLFGDSSSGISEALKEGIKELESFLTEQKIQADAQRLKAFADWLDSQIADLGRLADRGGNIDNIYILDNGLLDHLRNSVSPENDNIYTAIYDLEVLIDEDDSLSASGIYVFGISLYLLALKMILQLEALVASNYQNQGNLDSYNLYNKLWLYDYNDFEIAINGHTDNDGKYTPGWAKKVSDKINGFYTHRLAKITDLYRASITEGDPRCESIGEICYRQVGGWTWKDTANKNDTDSTNFVADTTEGGCCSHDVEHKDQAETNRANWINTVSGQLDAKYQTAKDTIKKWTASIYEWNEHLPPLAPTSAPEIDPKGWQGKPPNDPHWKAGNQVSYAVQFSNDSGPSPISDYNQAVDINPEMGATIINIPNDPSLMAMQVLIYRRITTEGGQHLDKLLAGKKIGITSFQDVGS